MSKVRNYFKKREKRNDEITYRDKIRNHKLTFFYRFLLMVVLIAGVITFLVIQWNNKVYTENVISSSAQVNITQEANAERLGDYVLIYSKDGASCIDAKGNVVVNQTFEMQNPMLSVCGNVAAIGDYNGRNIYVVNTEERMGEINIDTPIHSFCVAENGMVAVVLEDGNITRIQLYLPTGGDSIATFKTTMNQSGYPIKVSISPNGKLVCVSYVYVDSGVIKSSVAFYNFGRVGQNEDERYMSGYNYLDSIVPYVQFINDDTAFGVSDDRIVFFRGDERPVFVKGNMLEEEVRSIYYNNEYVGLTFNDTTGEALYRLDVYDHNGNLVLSKKFNIEYKDIIFDREQIIIYNDLECLVINDKGLEKYSGTFDKAILQMIPVSSYYSYKYTLVSADAIDVIELK